MAITVENIIKAIQNKLGPDAQIVVIDESSKHYGHNGFKNSSPVISHIFIKIKWIGFKELKTIDKQRLINNCLTEFFNNGLHAVRYELITEEVNVC